MTSGVNWTTLLTLTTVSMTTNFTTNYPSLSLPLATLLPAVIELYHVVLYVGLQGGTCLTIALSILIALLSLCLQCLVLQDPHK